MVTKKPDIVVGGHLAYLDNLREEGGIDMYRAGPYLERKFGLTKAKAKKVLTYWIESYVERHDGVTVQQEKSVGQDMAADMTKVSYWQLGTGVFANVLRVKGHEYSYLDHETGEWVLNDTVAKDVHIEADTFEITLKQAKALVKARTPTLEPEWLDDSPGKSTKIDFPLFTLEHNGKEYTHEDYHDTTPFAQQLRDERTTEQTYTLTMLKTTPSIRNLVLEKDLDMSKLDPELLANAKVWIDEDGNYHPEVMEE